MIVEPSMTIHRTIDQMKMARRQLGNPAGLNEAIVATGIDALFILLAGDAVEFSGIGIVELGSPDCLGKLRAIADAWNRYLAISDTWLSSNIGRPDEWLALVSALNTLTEGER